eukprot:1196642-Rhodomonas_salina.2
MRNKDSEERGSSGPGQGTARPIALKREGRSARVVWMRAREDRCARKEGGRTLTVHLCPRGVRIVVVVDSAGTRERQDPSEHEAREDKTLKGGEKGHLGKESVGRRAQDPVRAVWLLPRSRHDESVRRQRSRYDVSVPRQRSRYDMSIPRAGVRSR